VFRKPQGFMAFAVLVGTGVQVSFMVGTAIMCATLGGQEIVGGLLVVSLPFYGFLNGYISSIYYRFFNGSAWVKLSLLSAMLFPACLTLIYCTI
jgi:hypothetical protein